MSDQYASLPTGLPIPVDDGLATHLRGMSLPQILLESTSGTPVDIAEIPGRLVMYVYLLSGRPGEALPDGWNDIPGARGCTPQACDFSDHYQELQHLGATLFGLSSQTSSYQAELKSRLYLPFDLLSDSEFKLKRSLNLPVFQVGDLLLYKRLTLIVEAQIIQKVFYRFSRPTSMLAKSLIG